MLANEPRMHVTTPNSSRLHAARTHSVLRYALVIALSVVLLYLGSIARNGQQTPLTTNLDPAQRGRAMVDGRWKTVRKSLGLPLLPLGHIEHRLRRPGSTQPPKSQLNIAGLRYNLQLTSRFDLRHKREIEEATPDPPISRPAPPTLFFTKEALDEPTVSYSAFLKSLQMATEVSGSAKPKGKGTLQKNEGKKRATPRWFKRDD